MDMSCDRNMVFINSDGFELISWICRIIGSTPLLGLKSSMNTAEFVAGARTIAALLWPVQPFSVYNIDPDHVSRSVNWNVKHRAWRRANYFSCLTTSKPRPGQSTIGELSRTLNIFLIWPSLYKDQIDIFFYIKNVETSHFGSINQIL